jgi:short-subunit dehydrogenase
MATGQGAAVSTALITGASSGIGESLARCFARAGHCLVLVARSRDKLKALALALASEFGVRTVALPADLSQPGAVPALAARLRRRHLTIDVLVNNAGVLAHGPFVGMAAQRNAEVAAAANRRRHRADDDLNPLRSQLDTVGGFFLRR